MKLTNAILFLLCISIGFPAQAQTEKCGIVKRDSIARATNPDYLKRKENYYKQVQKIQSNAKTALEIIRIPVVVHVIHNDSNNIVSDNPAIGNISREQIESQITVLNEDFRRMFDTPGYNINPDGADMEIEFCLAGLDPEGMPTEGITRHFINRGIYDLGDDSFIKGIEHWSPENYLNIYTVPRLDNNFLGYATFPYEAETNPQLDGIVIANRFFGDLVGSARFGIPYDRGRTLTHEVGHWLGLLHTWGDGGCNVDDGCDDTPQSSSGNLRCDTTAFKCGSFDMVRNYMDYSNDLCFNIFTKCQKDLARSVFNMPFPLGKREFLEDNGLMCEDTFIVRTKSSDLNIRVEDTENAKYTLDNLLPNEICNVVVYDLKGRIIKNESIQADDSGRLRFNISEQPAGVYIMNISFFPLSSKRFKIYGPLR